MRTFILLFAAAAVTGFGFGIAATSAARNAADRMVEPSIAQYCEKGFTEFGLKLASGSAIK